MDSIILQREEIKVYLFSLALPMTEWSWQRAFELSTFVLYPEVSNNPLIILCQYYGNNITVHFDYVHYIFSFRL
jgi:hypothetical protein